MNKLIAIVGLIGIGLVSLSYADEKHVPVKRMDSSEFQQMKQLVGSWTGTSIHKDGKSDPAEVTYKLTAGGSALAETLFPGTPHEMLTMYNDEGGKLAMTHYCMLGNTPHLSASRTSAKELQFDLIPNSGIDVSKEAHMHSLTITFADADHVTQSWTSYEGGKLAGSTVIKLSRVH